MPVESLNDTPEEVLDNLHLIEDGKLKNAAILLFGKEPARFFTCADFRLGRFIQDDTDLIFQDIVEGNIIQMADRVMETLKSKYLISPIHYEGMQRIEPLEIPEKALREAIYNAIIHKDYTGVQIQMKVFNDHIWLWNDGNLPENYTVETLLHKHTSKPRNLNIANAFYKAGFIESWGRGIGIIQAGFKNAGLSAPKLEATMGGVLIVMPRGCPNVNETVNETVNKTVKISKSEACVLDLIQNDNAITYQTLMKVTKLSRATIARIIKKLQDKGFIHRIGSDKNGIWEISNK